MLFSNGRRNEYSSKILIGKNINYFCHFCCYMGYCNYICGWIWANKNQWLTQFYQQLMQWLLYLVMTYLELYSSSGGLLEFLQAGMCSLLGEAACLYAMVERRNDPEMVRKIASKIQYTSRFNYFDRSFITLNPLLGHPMLTWLVDARGLAIVIAYLLCRCCICKIA